MAGATNSAEGVLANLSTPILPNIGGETTREELIELDRLVNGNATSVSSNLGGGQHGHLVLKMTSEEYAAHTGFAFVPLHNPSNYLPIIGNTQKQGLGTGNPDKIKCCFKNTPPWTDL